MELNKELEKLESLKTTNPDQFEAQYLAIKKEFTSQEDVTKIDEFVMIMLSNSAKKIDEFIEEATIKSQLAEVSKIISLSYISSTYFKKSRNWLSQKVNNCRVNGKPAKFTPEEISQFNFALQDISKKIGSTAISVS